MTESRQQAPGLAGLGSKRAVLLALTLLLSGRAMTVAFIGQAGAGGPGDPPSAWLMPLVGDAMIGVSALLIAYLVVRGNGIGAWIAIIVGNIVGVWDALSAFLVQESVPWPVSRCLTHTKAPTPSGRAQGRVADGAVAFAAKKHRFLPEFVAKLPPFPQ